MHEVLVNRLGGLSLPRKSVVRLTDRPDMTLDVYRGCKTTMQQQQQPMPIGVARWCWVNFHCWGILLAWIRVGQGPTALAVGAGGGCLGIFLSSIISLSFFPLSGRRPDID